MFDFLAGVIAFFYDLWPSYGMAIVLFTLAIMLVLTPLSIKSTRSMIAMQRVQPELKKLQAQHKNDKEALQREMMAFYQANNINPFSSCLPLLLQMPIFIVLFLAPVYVPLTLLSGWIHAVATVNPFTALIEGGRDLISGQSFNPGLVFGVSLVLLLVFTVWGVLGLRRAEAAG